MSPCNGSKRTFKSARAASCAAAARSALTLVSGGIEIEVEQAGRREEDAGAVVVIADGGFQANLDMLRQSGVSPAPEKLLARNGGTAVGDGLRMALGLGAAPSGGMNNFYGHLHNRDAMQSTKHWPRPVTDDLAAAGIVIDAEGRRFTDEALGGIWISNAIARLPDPLGTTIIFDHAIWEGPPGRNHAQPPNPLVVEAGGTLHRADTLAELAGKIGLAPERLSDVVGEYNKAVERARRKSSSPRAPQRAEQGLADQDGAVLCDADLRGDHQHHGRHRGGWRRSRARSGRQGDPGPLRRRLHRRWARWRPHAGYVGGLIKATFGFRAAETIAARASTDAIASGFSPPSPARYSRPRRFGRTRRTRDRHRHRLDPERREALFHRGHLDSLGNFICSLPDDIRGVFDGTYAPV